MRRARTKLLKFLRRRWHWSFGVGREDTSFWWSRINHVFGDVLQEE